MKKAFGYSFLLLIFSLLFIAAIFALNSHVIIGVSLSEAGCLTFSFYFILGISLIVFFIGQTKDTERQGFYTLVSISLKFLLELALALIWFLISKKTSLSSVLLFFVLYLTFTIFSIIMILNTLKDN